MQIGSRPCRIYGEAHAEYLLLQMTGEHEQQSMESEVNAAGFELICDGGVGTTVSSLYIAT